MLVCVTDEDWFMDQLSLVVQRAIYNNSNECYRAIERQEALPRVPRPLLVGVITCEEGGGGICPQYNTGVGSPVGSWKWEDISQIVLVMSYS